MSTSDKKSANILSAIFKSKGIKDIVISPGSRNAPLIITFAGDDFFNCLTIVDERSAGFFALGMAIEKKRPVVLVCTSGSALLNYAPAVSEAFYRHIPLLIVSADRPPEMIDQGDGQTIRQSGALDKHLNYSYSLPTEIKNNEDEWFANRLINEAVINCDELQKGPVHINIPFREPLYGKTDMANKDARLIDYLIPDARLHEHQLKELSQICNASGKMLILLGEQEDEEQLTKTLKDLINRKQAVILTETLTNISGENIFTGTDKIISTISEDEAADFKPDLLLTTDGPIVSKMVKNFLRNHPPTYHWHVSLSDTLTDTYKNLTHAIPVKLNALLEDLIPHIKEKDSLYFELWNQRAESISMQHRQFLQETPWSDLKVFDILQEVIPETYTIHFANSTIVRYAQLFDKFYEIKNYSNRGTSGIDGSVSTAAGAAYASQKDTILVTGDLSFLYDSNGLWNKYITPKLKIIIINNGGGGIFRFIPGPDNSGHMEEFFEAKGNSRPVQPLAEMHGFKYLKATSEKDMKAVLKDFFGERDNPAILEVFTPAEKNAEVLKRYFENLKEGRR